MPPRRVPHPPDFLWGVVGPRDFIRLSSQLITGFADPQRDEAGL
jgi:hypothetical protein